MRQPAWDVYETVILIDAYYKILSGDYSRKKAVKLVSDTLRKRATSRGIKIDQTFRNENGIQMRFEELSYIDSNSSKGLRNSSKLFRDTMKMYRKNRAEFDSILSVAQSQTEGIISTINPEETAIENKNKKSSVFVGSESGLDFYLESLNIIIEWLSSHNFIVKQSYDYLSDESKARNDMLYKVYYGSKDVMWVYLIYSKKSHYISLETEPEYLSDVDNSSIACDKIQIRKSRPCLKAFFTSFTDIEKSLSIICSAIIRNINISRKSRTTYGSSEHSSKDLSVKVDNQTIKNLLIEKFGYGCRYSSPIELVRLRSYYQEKYGDQLECSDDELKQMIKACGFEFDRKIYVLSENIYTEINKTINDCIDSGVSVIFFEPFYERNVSKYQQEGIISWEMLEMILIDLYPAYHHNANCMVFSETRVPELSIIEAEIVRVWGEKVLRTVEELTEALPYIPYDKVKYVLSYSKRFVRDSAETYADSDKFIVDDNQIDLLLNQIATICDVNGRATIDDLNVEEIRAENFELSDLSFWDIVLSIVSEKYDVNHKVITNKGESHLAEDAIIDYCSNKAKCTQTELEKVMQEVTGEVRYSVVINAASSVMVRVDADTFISDEELKFDVTVIDSILKEIVKDGFIGLKEINSFGLFPFCGQPWNLFLIESYCRRFSKEFSYRCITANNKNVGAIVRKDVDYDYHQIMTNAVARSCCDIQENEVFDYLINSGYIMRRKYSNISELMSAAKEIRERGKK